MLIASIFPVVSFIVGFVSFFIFWPITKHIIRLLFRVLLSPIDLLAWLVERGFFFPRAMRIEKELQVIKMRDEMKVLDRIIANPKKLIDSEYKDMSASEYAKLINDQEFKRKEGLLRQEKRKGVIHAIYE